jgi:hypothetical protein
MENMRQISATYISCFPPDMYAEFPMLAGCILLVFGLTWMLTLGLGPMNI